jgi:hypothetical protein
MIHFRCLNCNKSLSASEERVGQVGRCQCGQASIVPAPLLDEFVITPTTPRSNHHYGLIICGVLLLVLVVVCGGLFYIGVFDYHGKKLVMGKGEVYYTRNVTVDEAKSLATHLTRIKFFGKDKKTVQLDREGSTYLVRFVIKKGLDQDQDYVKACKALAAELSLYVFDGKRVDIHLCDERLRTIRVVIY